MIYFIEIEGTLAIKIGYTAGTAERRMAQLQTGQPAKLKLLGTMPGELCDEQSLHEELSDLRLNGEWFSPEIISIVQLLIERQGPWFICREPEIRRKKMEAEWGLATKGYGGEQLDQYCFTEANLRSAVRSIIGFDKAIRKFKDKHGKVRNPSHDLYKIVANIPDSIYQIAGYVAAWQGAIAPKRANSLG